MRAHTIAQFTLVNDLDSYCFCFCRELLDDGVIVSVESVESLLNGLLVVILPPRRLCPVEKPLYQGVIAAVEI